MKKRKVLIVCCAFLLLFGLSFKKVNAQESKVIYVNSEESKLEWDGLQNAIGYDSTLIDDGQYQAGKPGEYTVKFKDSSGEEKQVRVVVVQSEGSIVSVMPLNGRYLEISEEEYIQMCSDDSEIRYGAMHSRINKDGGALVTIKTNLGALKTFNSDMALGGDGGGGEPDDNTRFHSLGFVPASAQKWFFAKGENDVKYYNESGDTGFGIGCTQYCFVYYLNKENKTITSKNDDIKIETYVSSMSGKIKINSTDLSIDNKIKKKLKTSNYKAISLSLTDDSNQVYQVNEKTKISYKLDSRYDKNKMAVYQLKDEKITLLENKVEGDYVVFEAPILPGQYIIAEKAKEELITPPAINDKSPKEETKKSDIVKTSDISWGVYVGLMVVSLGYIIILRMKIRE